MEFNRKTELGRFLTFHGLLGCGVEVGVRYGSFSRIILDTWAGQRLYLVDTWAPMPEWQYSQPVDERIMRQWFTRTLENVRPHNHRVSIIQNYSHIAVNAFKDESFDFSFIDANHAYEFAKRDLECYWLKLRPGGLFAGDDYLDQRATKGHPVDYGVKRAVDEFAATVGAVVRTTNDQHPCWYWFKER